MNQVISRAFRAINSDSSLEEAERFIMARDRREKFGHVVDRFKHRLGGPLAP